MDVKKSCITRELKTKPKIKKSLKRLSKNASKANKNNFKSPINSKDVNSTLSKSNSTEVKKISISKMDTLELNSKLSKNNLKDDKKSKTEKFLLSSELSKNNLTVKKNKSSKLNLKLSKNILNKNEEKPVEIWNQSVNFTSHNTKPKGKKEKSIITIDSPQVFQRNSGDNSKKSLSKVVTTGKTTKVSENGLKQNKQKLSKTKNIHELPSISKKKMIDKTVYKKDSVTVNTKLPKVASIKNKNVLLKQQKQSNKLKNTKEDIHKLKKKQFTTNVTENVSNTELLKKKLKYNKSISKIDSTKNVADDSSSIKTSKTNFKSDKSLPKKDSTQLNNKLLETDSMKTKNIFKKSKKQNSEFKKSINKEDASQSRKRKLTTNISEDSNSVAPSKKLKAKCKNAQKYAVNNEIQSIKSKKRKPLNAVDSSLTKDELINYVKGLFKVVESDEHKKKSLFSSDKPPILLIVNCMKVPQQPLRQMRITLPHSMVSSNDDVALFVKDIKRGRRRDCEETIRHYEDLLKNHGISQIKTVISINQVKTEYRQYEMRRRMLNTYDHFLVEGKIAGHIAHLLGKPFRLRRKLPTSISFEKNNLKAEIDTALKKTIMQMHSNGDSFSVQVGTCSMDKEKIAENILKIIEVLHENFPGGWENIRCLRLKVPLSLAIPIYITLKNRNDIKVPKVAPKRPKAYKEVEGELSTFTGNVNVTVAPDGSVKVQKMDDDSDDEEHEIKDKDSTKEEMQDVTEDENEEEDKSDKESN